MSVKRLIGVDFGTSSTYIKVKHYENNKPVKEDKTSVQYVDFNGNAWVPSIIQSLGDNFWYGYDAQTKKSDNSVIYRNFKMSLEDDDEIKRNEAMRLTELFFSYLFKIYQDQFTYIEDKYDEIETIVSYPVKWKKETVQFLADVAKKAGFQNIKTMDEPTAALNAVLVQNTSSIMKNINMKESKSFNILMIDMGAGTTDLALLKCSLVINKDESGTVASKIVSTWPRGSGQLHFGGREVEEQLYNYLLKYLTSMSKVTESMAQNILIQQMDNIKSWKENTVSSTLNKKIDVTTCPFLAPIIPLITDNQVALPSFGRIQFEKEFSNYLECFIDLINGCINDSIKNINEFNGMKDVEFIILTGGHSQWYFVREMLDGSINKIGNTMISPTMIKARDKIFSLPRPQETVSLGLVYSPMKLELNSDEQPLIEYDNEQLGYTFVHFNKRIYKIDNKHNNIPVHLKWIEVEHDERSDSLLSLINKKYGLALGIYSYYIICFCKQFMIVKIYAFNKVRLIRINLDVPYPELETIYETDSSIYNIVSYGGVLYVYEVNEEKKTLIQISLDGTKKKFLLDTNSLDLGSQEKASLDIKYADDKYIYAKFNYYMNSKTKEKVVKLNYNQKPAVVNIMDEVRYEPCINIRNDNFYLYRNSIYYYNQTDGICVMNCESKKKNIILKGNYILWGVSEKGLVYSEYILDSYVGLYRMDLNGSNKKQIVNKIIEKSLVIGDWVVFLGKNSPRGIKGAFIEKYLISLPVEPYCVKVDGTNLNKLM